jgi:hypothetical protein
MTVRSRSVNVGRLKTLADKANREHSRAQGAARQSVKHAVEAGGLLLQAKKEVSHGDFTRWLEENFEGSPRHARRYMQLATAAAQNRIDANEVFSLREAENILRDQDAEPTREEYEPEMPGEEYELELHNGEHETVSTPQSSQPKSVRKRDLQASAVTAIHRFIHEVKGEEKDRIHAIRERLDMEESGLLVLVSEKGRRA